MSSIRNKLPSFPGLGRVLLSIGAAIAIYATCFQLAALGSAADSAQSWRGTGHWILQLWLPWFLLAPLALRHIQRNPVYAGGRREGVLNHLAAVIVLTCLHAAILAVIVERGAGVAPWRGFGSAVFEKDLLLADLLIYLVLMARHNFARLRREVAERDFDALKLNKSLVESRLQTLKMQLNPHFLFNTLNGVSVLVEKNESGQAQEMIAELCRFLRQTLSNSAKKWVSLEKELEMARHYLSIEKFRFGERLSYHEECEPLALSAKIPPMLLQPLFENAIVHGLSEKEGPCRLNFECRVHDRRLFILISDNGGGFDSSRNPLHKAGIGLANVEGRLREIYGADYSLKLERAYPQGTLVELRIPAYKDSIYRREAS